MLNLHESSISGRAFAPQAVNNSQVNGDDIVEPWRKGRRLQLTLVAAAMAANDALTITVTMRRRGTTTYDAVQDADGNDLTFTVASTSDGGQLDDGYLHGELNLERLHPPDAQYEYDAIRLQAVNAVAQNVELAASYLIGMLYENPDRDGNADLEDLLSKQLWRASVN